MPKRAKTILDKVQTLSEPKQPTEKARQNYVGVELEFFNETSHEDLKLLLADANLDKVCHLDTDGSIAPTRGEGHELQVLAPEKDIKLVITRVCEVLNRTAAGVNTSCGLHVHLDMRHRNAHQVYTQLFQTQPALYSLVPQHRRDSIYCVPNEKPHFAYAAERFGINTNALREHGTLELRMHAGTVNAEQINHWISILLAIVKTKKYFSHPVQDVETLHSIVKLKPETLDYARKRARLLTRPIGAQETPKPFSYRAQRFFIQHFEEVTVAMCLSSLGLVFWLTSGS